MIAVNQDFIAYWVQEKNRKLKNLHMDSLYIVKVQVHQQYLNFDIHKKLINKYGARSIDIITK